ncbi:hypothetical protein PCANC_16800 [Puccinia coronata f. sp. avenae]|uniref:Dynamin-type G domain-containing protein n=1 Tax=Puccinia coronata f. sp. avenae TaxID=200324 RepID=A0A2N5UP04_9BASI|nr:hypothetical protein PCANC_16800 [Puccinia coronata f. sp. avenae]
MNPIEKPPVLECPASDLDKVDMIRKLGLQDMFSLPQIAVVGDQSSGKSSLLEYISGITFPKDAGMCTCFATEVSMRPAPEFSAKVFINNQRDSRLREPKAAHEVSGVIQEAKDLFVEAHGKKYIYDDTLTVELYGPGLPILTLVDLPGYIHTHSIGQPESLVEEIENLVEGYLHSPRTVIMAVIPVNRDFETNVAIKHIRRFDPEGKRTLCVLTKPDQVDSGTERNVIDILSGKKMYIERGYHIVKNKNYEECQVGESRETTAKKESQFFSKSPWSSVNITEKGIASLVGRLSETLSAHVAKEFSGLRKEITRKRDELVKQFNSLGPEVGTDLEKSNLLRKNINRIMQQIKFLVDGHYSAGHFSRKYYIRAHVQELNRGFYKLIHALTTASVDNLNVSKIMQESRGRELRGMVQFEPFVILCRKVIKKWSLPTTNHITKVCGLVETISSRVIVKECDKILVDYFLERMVEYINQQHGKIDLDASEIFDDELTPLTCQEFILPGVVSDPPPPPTNPKNEPYVEEECVPPHESEYEYDPAEGTSEDLERNSGTDSDSSSGSEDDGRGSRPADTAEDKRIRSFVREYCRAAATRYVDAICLYVVERRLFKNCDVRFTDWFMKDNAVLAHVREPAHISSLRKSLPIKIKELNSALVILDS